MLNWLKNLTGGHTKPKQETAEQVRQLMKGGFAHFQGGNQVAAEALFEIILREQPNHADALYLSGVIAGSKGENRKAIELISRAIAIDGSVASFHLTLAKGAPPEQYVSISLRLATDKNFRDNIKAKILSRCTVLFEEIEVVHEFERFFVEAHKFSTEHGISS